MSGIRQTNVIDSRGQEMLTAAVIVKDVNHLISEIVTRTTTLYTARAARGDH